MPCRYEIDKQREIVFTRAWGDLTDEDALAHQRRLSADPDFDPGFRQLLDFSEVSTFEITPNGVRLLASRDPWGKGARRAFVAPGDLEFGMLRMHEFILDDETQETAVLRSLSEAESWLELDKSQPG